MYKKLDEKSWNMFLLIQNMPKFLEIIQHRRLKMLLTLFCRYDKLHRKHIYISYFCYCDKISWPKAVYAERVYFGSQRVRERERAWVTCNGRSAPEWYSWCQIFFLDKYLGLHHSGKGESYHSQYYWEEPSQVLLPQGLACLAPNRFNLASCPTKLRTTLV